DQKRARFRPFDGADVAFGEKNVFRAQAQRAAAGQHGVTRVDGEVQQNLVNLRGVGLNGPEVARHVFVEHDRLGKTRLHDIADIAQQVLHLREAEAAAAPVGKAENLPHEGGTALGAFFEDVEHAQILGGSGA